jgi:hypothetical protein
MGRYIECGEDIVYKYAKNQESELNLVHDFLGIGRLKHFTAEESYLNGCDMLYLTQEEIAWLKGYFDWCLKEIERENNKSIKQLKIGEEISIDEGNFLVMINHLIHYADQHPNKDVYAFDSEL